MNENKDERVKVKQTGQIQNSERGRTKTKTAERNQSMSQPVNRRTDVSGYDVSDGFG